ncbi:hypothetical protein Nepgr_021195 [Nepenthes gracilis]|uniref:Uncharacterized protein n=1 Tax=Nepenthes gracilis TaxID=150966 RepID=A0AAD3SZ44_NEPGR|nr:hypothetical protein Nepgr_021195 [Nepenthes gracilis]
MIMASPSSSSTDTGVPISKRMIDMKKSIGASILPSVSSASIVPATVEAAELTSNVQMPDRNTGSEITIFGGLPPLSKICSEPRTEEALSALIISDSTQSAYLQDQIQEATVASEEDRHLEIPIFDPMEVQDRARPDWMNTPASSSYPSPGGHPDRPSTPASRMSLNEIALNARFI